MRATWNKITGKNGHIFDVYIEASKRKWKLKEMTTSVYVLEWTRRGNHGKVTEHMGRLKEDKSNS